MSAEFSLGQSEESPNRSGPALLAQNKDLTSLPKGRGFLLGFVF